MPTTNESILMNARVSCCSILQVVFWLFVLRMRLFYSTILLVCVFEYIAGRTKFSIQIQSSKPSFVRYDYRFREFDYSPAARHHSKPNCFLLPFNHRPIIEYRSAKQQQQHPAHSWTRRCEHNKKKKFTSRSQIKAQEVSFWLFHSTFTMTHF